MASEGASRVSPHVPAHVAARVSAPKAEDHARPGSARGSSASAVIAAWCGIGAAIFGLLGGLFVGVGVSALPDPWIRGYVSEGGVAGAGHSTVYRIGIAALAVSIGLLGLAVNQQPAQPRIARWPAVAWMCLVIAAGLGLVSSRVSCTAGCPLPPYQRTTFQDLVHAATSVGAVGLVALAMLVIAVVFPPGALRSAARVATVVSMPLLIALAVAILAAGAGTLTGVLERISLVAVLASVIGTALIIARAGRRPPSSA
jgi:Protein of unknown function (DUF998)